MFSTKVTMVVMLLLMIGVNAGDKGLKINSGTIADPYKGLKTGSGALADSYKGLKIGSGTLADSRKGLGIGSGKLRDTKKSLYKSRFLSRSQLPRLLAECKAELGADVYEIVEKKSQKLLEKRATHMWGLEQNSVIREEAKRKEKREEDRVSKTKKIPNLKINGKKIEIKRDSPKTIIRNKRKLVRIKKKYERIYIRLDDEDKESKEKVAEVDSGIMRIVKGAE